MPPSIHRPTGAKATRRPGKTSCSDPQDAVAHLTTRLQTALVIVEEPVARRAQASTSRDGELAGLKERMATVNNASQILGEVMQSGWKLSVATDKKSCDTVRNVGRTCKRFTAAIEALRISRTNSTNTERAVSTFVGKLIAIEMVRVDSLRVFYCSLHHRTVRGRPPYPEIG